MSTASQSIREITSNQPSALRVFKHFEIDPCSVADKSLAEVCADLQLSVDQVVEKLTELQMESGSANFDPVGLTLSQLIQHIVRTHHQRIRWDLPGLIRIAKTLGEQHGTHAAELSGTQQLLEELHKELLAHIQKEEAVLFPFIARMEDDSELAYPADHACFRELSHPVFMMVQDHEVANRLMAELRQGTNSFEAPAWACPTHHALLGGLCGFEKDLAQHVHLENDVLFPRALGLEAELQRGR